MASDTPAAQTTTSAPALSGQQQPDPALSSSPVEMNNLSTSAESSQAHPLSHHSSSSPSPLPPSTNTTAVSATQTPIQPTTSSAVPEEPPLPSIPPQEALNQPIQSQSQSAEASSSRQPAVFNRTETAEPIGASTERPTMATDPTAGPTLLITLLLITGSRHPYKIDKKYLQRRNSSVNDPYQLTVYNLKELIWRDWRQEGACGKPSLLSSCLKWTAAFVEVTSDTQPVGEHCVPLLGGCLVVG